MQSQNKKNNNKNKNKSSKRGSGKGNFNNRFHIINELSTAISGVSQITIAPSLSDFPKAMSLYASFQSYQITRVEYRLIPRFNISSQPGAFPILLRIPLTSSDLVPANVSAYTGVDKL